jgi:hypothetical protein
MPRTSCDNAGLVAEIPLHAAHTGRELPMMSLVALMLGGVLSQAAPPTPAGDRVELERLERVWNEAHEQGDASALDALWAPDLAVTVPGMPVMGKADSLAIWRSGRMKWRVVAWHASDAPKRK